MDLTIVFLLFNLSILFLAWCLPGWYRWRRRRKGVRQSLAPHDRRWIVREAEKVLNRYVATYWRRI